MANERWELPEREPFQGGTYKSFYNPILKLIQGWLKELKQTEAEKEALRITSESTTNHAMTINVTALTGSGSALNLVSANVELSCVQISGHETAKGTLKISHVNASGTEAGDAGAAAISIDLQKGAETNTASQGIFMTCTTSESTGPWLTVRNEAKALIARMKANGFLEFKELTGAPTSVEGWGLYAEAKKLFIKFGAEAAKEITIP